MKDAKYRPLPGLSPYVQGNRYEILKEDHKYFIEKLKRTVDVKRSYRLADVGCGNGEMLYQFKKAFPHWQFTGYDYTAEFIETAKKFPGLKEVRFFHKNIDQVDETFDIVFCSSVLQIFTEVEKPLLKLLAACVDGGHLFADGCFNEFDIEVRLQYCDNTREESKGLWRCDWNQHSRESVRKILTGKVKSFEFEEVVNDLDIPVNPTMPINRFTFRDASGKNITTNGTNLMMKRILLSVLK